MFVRVFKNRRKAEFSLGVSATRKDFEDALLLSATASRQRLAVYLRGVAERIDAMRLDAAQYGIDAGMDAAEVRDAVKRVILFDDGPDGGEVDEDKLFLPFFRRCIDSKSNAGYRVSREYTYKTVVEFADGAVLTFEDIDLKWLNRFDEWLVGKGLKQNSRNIHFKNIRTVINRAIDEELTDKYPFRRFKIRTEETRKRALPVEELRRLFTCEVEPYQEFYRDMAKLIFMLRGINAADLYGLESVTADGRVEYRRAKTHRLYSVKVEPEAMEIIERWRGKRKLLCIADRWKDAKDFTKWLNLALKRIGVMRSTGRGGKKEIEPFWGEISSYWMRHSWATILYNDCGVGKDIIAQGLGHKSGLAVTEIYLDKDRELVDAANRRVLDWVLYGKRHGKRPL